ncbi:hypothetical protein F2Q68_00043717 [Brassica cretica]|nr:hypothetical protein F2Q68_00043717 [Brassica cretica]
MVKLIIDLMGLNLVRRCALPCRWVVGLHLRLLSVCTVLVSFSNGVCVCCWCVQYCEPRLTDLLLDLIWFLVRSGSTLLVQMWLFGLGLAVSQARHQQFLGSSFRSQHFIIGSWMSYRSYCQIRVDIMDQQPEPVTYVCGDCGQENTLKSGDVIQCRECGYRILYKKRTRRVVQYEAR